MKILTVVGARPQFIKLAPVLKELKKYHTVVNVHTGQHYDWNLSATFFEDLKIDPPQYNLGIGSGSHGYQTAHMIMAIENVLIKERPDLLLVFGDTNSTLSAAIAGVKLRIPIGHIECGLRNYDISIPEEVNRIVTERVSTLLFAPTKKAVENLKKEGRSKNVFLTGDVMYDSYLMNHDYAREHSAILERLNIEPKKYMVATIHHAENTDNIERLSNIFDAFSRCGETIVIPLHPRTRKQLGKCPVNFQKRGRLVLSPPLGYLDFLKLLDNSKKVMTDSGGIQKEAYFMKIPCITVYQDSEWTETVEDGWNVVVNPIHKNSLLQAIRHFHPTGPQHHHFGTGKASLKIVGIINKFFLPGHA